jgi:tetratricopeptide (TPR) repeat protein
VAEANRAKILLIVVLLIAGLITSCGKIPKTELKVNTGKTTVAETSNLTINQKEARNQFNLGNTYYYVANYTMAVASYIKAIEFDSSFADAYYRRGNVYHNTGELDKVIIDYNKTLELNPKNIDAMVDIYMAYKAQENYIKADY